MSDNYPKCTCGDTHGHREQCPTLRHPFNKDGSPKIAPVQGYMAGIPWSLHLEAYDAYRAKWSGQAAMIDLELRGCRGGFSVGELDDFIPGWRERVAEITYLRERVARLRRIVHRYGDRVPMATCAREDWQQEIDDAMAFVAKYPEAS